MKAINLFLFVSLLGVACTSRNRVGPQGSDGDGGIIDSTAKYDNTSAKVKDDSTRIRTTADSTGRGDTTHKR